MNREEFRSMSDGPHICYGLAEFDTLRALASLGDMEAQAELRKRRARGETDRVFVNDLFVELRHARRSAVRSGGPAWNQYYGELRQQLVSPLDRGLP